MPSHRYVPVSSKGRMHSFSNLSNNAGLVAGGAVPLLLKNIIKEPITGGSVEPSRSNIMIGTVSSSSPSPSSKITSGGELLSSMQKLKFGKGMMKRKEENIRFLF